MLLSTVLALALPCSAAPAAKAQPAIANPWSFELGRDRRGSRVTMSYRIRWDASDLKAAPSRLRAAVAAPAGFVASGLRGMAQGVRLDLYGVRLRPFRSVSSGVDSAAVSTAAAAAGAQRRFAGQSVLDDLRVDARRELKAFLIRSLFDRSLPQATAAPAWEKEAVIAGLLDTGRTWASR